MPERSRKVFATQVGRVSRTVGAPLPYVYDWLTDYRSDDGKYSKSRPRFRVLRMGRDRIVRVRYSKARGKQPAVAVEVVRLRPPDSWHVDQIDEADLEAVDYKLKRLGRKRTRVTLDIVERWMVPKFPNKADWLLGAGRYWDGLVGAIEEQYRKGLPAKA